MKCKSNRTNVIVTVIVIEFLKTDVIVIVIVTHEKL